MKTIAMRAYELKDEIIADRRHLHRRPEVGMELHETVSYVMGRLTEMGYEPKKCGKSGVTAVVGNPGKVFLLRADMDALPMDEASGLPFSSEIPGKAHTCGHDAHTAILLGAAKILKENEKDLKGTVKLMFQPGEEIFAGSLSMIEDGVLENPKVDAAMAMHVFPMFPLGTVGYRAGEMMASVDGFEIAVTGKGCHGAQSYKGVDPINIAVHIHTALQELISRETDSNEQALLTIGSIHAGEAANIIPQSAVMKGTIRTFSASVREFLVKRLCEISESVAKTFRGSAEVSFMYQVPPCICDESTTKELVSYVKEGLAEHVSPTEIQKLQGSEDFALIAQRVPSTYFTLGADFPGKETITAPHHPGILFNEDIFPVGSAIYAECAVNWLKSHS